MSASPLERRLLLAFGAALLLTVVSVASAWRAGTDVSATTIGATTLAAVAFVVLVVLVVLFRGIRKDIRSLDAALARRAEEVETNNRLLALGAAQIESANKQLELRAAEIEAVNKQLELRAAEVESINKELETFAYSVSHDLRAPLRHISGYVQLLSQALEGRLEDEQNRYLAVIAQASRDMAELIDDLLSFSRMTRTDLHRARVAPRDVVDSVIAGLQMEIRDRRIDWRIDDLPPVEADAAMLRIVYANLIGNAVKYSAPRERAAIEIGAAGEEDGRAVLFVRDNGVGFDMAYSERLFGIFQRLHPPQEFEGTGIGLATVQRIVARHGGRVWAEAAPGEGATFYFTLAKAA